MHIDLVNGVGADQQAANQNLTLLADAVRNSTASSPDQTNTNGRGVVVIINVVAVPASPTGLTVVLQTKDPVSGNYITFATLTSAAITATGLKAYACYPGISNGYSSNTNSVVPRTWRVQVQHGDSGNYEYSVGASVLV